MAVNHLFATHNTRNIYPTWLEANRTQKTCRISFVSHVYSELRRAPLNGSSVTGSTSSGLRGRLLLGRPFQYHRQLKLRSSYYSALRASTQSIFTNCRISMPKKYKGLANFLLLCGVCFEIFIDRRPPKNINFPTRVLKLSCLLRPGRACQPKYYKKYVA